MANGWLDMTVLRSKFGNDEKIRQVSSPYTSVGTPILNRFKTTISDDSWVVNLRATKRSKFMGWLTNKIKAVIKEEDNESTYRIRFNYMKDELNILNDKIDALYQLTSKEYVFIDQISMTYYGDKVLKPFEARKYFRDLGYEYITNYEHLGELWVKEAKNG